MKAAVDYVRRLPYVNPGSVGLFGCSGGGDLALDVGTHSGVAALVVEEPASVMLTGTLTLEVPKTGERYTPRDALPILAEPMRYYTAAHKIRTREKLGRIQAPILLLQGSDENPVNNFNRLVLVPELKAAGKAIEIRTFAGEPHCFAFAGRGVSAHRAFQAAEEFLRRFIATAPQPLDANGLRYVPVE